MNTTARPSRSTATNYNHHDNTAIQAITLTRMNTSTTAIAPVVNIRRQHESRLVVAGTENRGTPSSGAVGHSSQRRKLKAPKRNLEKKHNAVKKDYAFASARPPDARSDVDLCGRCVLPQPPHGFRGSRPRHTILQHSTEINSTLEVCSSSNSSGILPQWTPQQTITHIMLKGLRHDLRGVTSVLVSSVLATKATDSEFYTTRKLSNR